MDVPHSPFRAIFCQSIESGIPLVGWWANNKEEKGGVEDLLEYLFKGLKKKSEKIVISKEELVNERRKKYTKKERISILLLFCVCCVKLTIM